VELAKELSQLQDMVEGEPFDKIVKQIEKSLGKSIDNIFSHLNPTPIAAGSLAQVHEGILKKENINVAIKVQRPNIHHIIKTDLKILEELSQIINDRVEVSRVYNLPEIVQELNKMILQKQLNIFKML
jgi:ubiquinone biosynthesis protein